ncbi:TSC22 domain family protein 2 [Ambystoma mexicanum]|uniref:TSC22 domain family protein 2 n=1 Tax=Ambystoma mexicanum TaxID=8296 RepID=UPI0037E8D19F
MSKMPAKKKSCFQITSVTTAQAANSIAEDTESLDGDPEESRTEDVSSEIFDVSRATDGGGGPEEDDGVGGGRSSSEETLHNVGSPGTVSPNTVPPAAAAPASSRFRVIKLDQGSGEPYRRGRWTCLEYYERETDTIRHGPVAEQVADRDSGLGGSHPGPSLDQPVDSSLGAGPHMSQAERTGTAPQQQHFLIGQQPTGGALYCGSMQPQVPGHNGIGALPQVGLSVPQSTAPVSQAQHFVYSQPQGQHQPITQSDYLQNRTASLHQGPVQQMAGSLPGGQVTGHNHSPGCAQGVGLCSDSSAQGSGPAQGGPSHSAVIPQLGGVVQTGVLPAGLVQQNSAKQHQLGAGSQGMGMTAAVQNVPVIAPAASVPDVPSSASITPISMPNVPAVVSHAQQSGHTTVTRSASLIQPIGLPGLQGAEHVQSNLSHFQPQAFSQMDDRRKSEPLPQPPSSLIAEHKHFLKPAMLDTIHLPVTTPMNIARSVFGISIPVDGEEDSASNASVVAIDNKIEQAMDLVKSHLMYAVREEVEVLKEQIKELIEKNSTLERENALLKSLTNNDHLAQLSNQPINLGSTSQQKAVMSQAPQTIPPPQQPNVSSA